MIADCTASSHAIASAPDAAAPALETWYVATSTGTRAMTLDELDEALERGEVDTSTRLWIPGMAEWEALGTVANLEDGPPLECTPGAMLAYGLDAERASQNEDGSVRPGAGDLRDYDPFSFPPPVDDIPDPNRALWASILPPAAEPAQIDLRPKDLSLKGVRLRVEPWWRAEERMPWVGLMLSGTFVLCMSLIGAARLLFAVPPEVDVSSAQLAQVSIGALTAPIPTQAPTQTSTQALASDTGSAPGEAPPAAPELIRYDEPERAPVAAFARTSRVERAVGKRKPAPRAALKKRTSRPGTPR